jgi:hypothetical protein
MQRRGTDPKHYEELRTLLCAAKGSAFKIWQLEPALKVLAGILGLSAAGGISYLIYQWRSSQILSLTYGQLGMLLLGMLGSLMLAKLVGARVTKWLSRFGTPKRVQSEVWRILMYVVLAFAGLAAAWFHIAVFDRWYLRRGELQRVTGEPAAPIKKPQ